MNITKEQVKDIATKAAKKVVETHNSMTAEEKILCVATAALYFRIRIYEGCLNS